MSDKSFDLMLGQRLQSLREARALSLAELATRSGVSKAMIGRVEKAQSSATAALLGRLCAGLGVTLSSLVAAADQPYERIARHADQPVWTDPETGYSRRELSPPSSRSALEIVEVALPPKACVPYTAWRVAPYGQQLVMLEGELRLSIAGDIHDLAPGDCIDFDVGHPNTFENRGRKPARYLVIIRKA